MIECADYDSPPVSVKKGIFSLKEKGVLKRIRKQSIYLIVKKNKPVRFADLAVSGDA
jgi:hypothetical protein